MRGRTSTTLKGTRGRIAGAAAAVAATAACAPAAPAAAAPPIGSGDGGFALTPVGSFDRPIHADNAPGTGDALYVVESEGRIMVLNGGVKLPTPFLDITGLVRCCGEEGLLSVAFHPDYAVNRLFYVYFNDNAGDLALWEFQRSKDDPFRAEPASARPVLSIPHPVQGNHNGGTIAFGPDRFLYAAPGDGGSGGDPPNNAQNPERLLGKLIRIDPRPSCAPVVGEALRDATPKQLKKLKRMRKRAKNLKGKKRKKALKKLPRYRQTRCVGAKKAKKKGGKGKRKRKRKTFAPPFPYASAAGNPFVGVAGRDEIYATGLRNPFRFTFDSGTGAIAIGDVGQGCREELNFRLNDAARGVNFGWSGYEGTRVHNASRVAPGTVFPVLEYDNTNAAGCGLGTAFNGTSVIAGFVVRDERLTAQYGRLLYSDAANPQIRSLIASQGGGADDQPTGINSPGSVFAFAEGAGNVLYVVTGNGPVYRMDPA